MTNRTDCPAFELLATAHHEAGHAVGAVLVSPSLVIESATIVPGDDYLGLVRYEPWNDDLLVPDPDDDDGDEICEHERQYMEAHDIVSYFGAMSEGMLRNGSLETSAPAGWDSDRAKILANAYELVGDDVWHKAGHGRGWARTAHDPAAVALTERHPHFWLAVGLVAGALMRQKTLDGFEVEALIRAARKNNST